VGACEHSADRNGCLIPGPTLQKAQRWATRVDKNTREGARNAANKGSGTIEHANSKSGDPHFHTRRGDGTKKRDNVHYNYPD